MPIQDLVAPLPPGVLSPPDPPLQIHTSMLELPQEIPIPRTVASTLKQSWGQSPSFLFLRCRGHDGIMELPTGPNESFQIQKFPLEGNTDHLNANGSYRIYGIAKTISGRTMVLSPTGVLALYPTSHLHSKPREEPIVFHTVLPGVHVHTMLLCPFSGVIGILKSSGGIHIRRYRWALRQRVLQYAHPNLTCFPLGSGISRSLSSDDLGDSQTVTL